ncbi:hypothetical protein [Micromonospora sp. HM134]|nr:hypothetical protein [Micromonospora sp. HM134]
MIRALIRTIRQHFRRPPAPLDATGPATLYGTHTGSWAIEPADRRDIW